MTRWKIRPHGFSPEFHIGGIKAETAQDAVLNWAKGWFEGDLLDLLHRRQREPVRVAAEGSEDWAWFDVAGAMVPTFTAKAHKTTETVQAYGPCEDCGVPEQRMGSHHHQACAAYVNEITEACHAQGCPQPGTVLVCAEDSVYSCLEHSR